MPAMVIGIDRVARGGEGRGQPRITSSVLGQAVRDLHHRPGLLRGKPAVNKQLNAIRSGKRESERSSHHAAWRIRHRKPSKVRAAFVRRSHATAFQWATPQKRTREA